ncbi:hypothetical protein CGCA056_v002542 [Colletotrichum aenigma]|uniref:uncharacterized protein n=1 Tax=Colletotrichum aenigma TaxID=1215731 RepID=UPI0018731832|nr:uncharacterized protein CGCA056_v002542 [Colletotrichum aenigma]KAF5526184.1 hypothetical protein CGCA056_v002542 [Colletotrichum aenigma]
MPWKPFWPNDPRLVQTSRWPSTMQSKECQGDYLLGFLKVLQVSRINTVRRSGIIKRLIRNLGDDWRPNHARRVHEEPPWSSPSSPSSSSALTSPSSRSPSPVPLPPWPSPPVRPPGSPVTRVQPTSLPQASTLTTQSQPDPSVAESTEQPLKKNRRRPRFEVMGPASHGLTYMARDQVLRLAGSCDLHHSDVSLVADTMLDDYWHHYEDLCICEQIGALILNTSVIALALAHCKFDPLELRIPETSLTKRRNQGDSWSAEFLPSQHKSDSGRVAMFDGKISDKLMVYLAEVFLEDYSDELAEQAIDKNGLDRDWWKILGISGGTYTIHYSCIMENDCYDNFGRIISIRTGRASVAGSFRNMIGENTIRDMDSIVNPMRCRGQTMAPSLLAGGTLLQPHYRPSKTKIFMDVALHETVIELELQVDVANSRNRYWGFKRCLVALLSGVIVPSCEHGLNSAYVLKKDREVAIEGFHMARFTDRSSDQVLVLALQGNKLEQLLACGMLMRELEMEQVGKHRWEPGQEYSWWKRGVLQTSSCLEFCIRL